MKLGTKILFSLCVLTSLLLLISRPISAMGSLFSKTYGHISVGEEKTFFTQDGTKMSGSLLMPKDVRSQVPVVIYALGSGKISYRSSWLPTSSFPWYKKIADVFLEQGIGVFFFDKRGVNKSGGNWRNSTFDTRATDLVAAKKMLSQDSRVNSKKIGIMGTSQGGWVCQIAAQKHPGFRFMILVSAPSVSVIEQVFDAEFLSAFPERVSNPHAKINKYKLNEFIAGFKNQFIHRKPRGYLGKIINFNPELVIKSINIPTVAFYGTRDPLVPPNDIPERDLIQHPLFRKAGNLNRWEQYTQKNDKVFFQAIQRSGHAMITAGEDGFQDYSKGFADHFLDRLDSWIEKNI